MATIPFACENILEASENPTHPCWGYLATHTYDLGQAVEVTKVAGMLDAGPSDFSYTANIGVQLSADGINFTQVGVVTLITSDGYVPFSVTVDKVSARYLRFANVTPGMGLFVDGSYGEVTTTGGISNMMMYAGIAVAAGLVALLMLKKK